MHLIVNIDVPDVNAAADFYARAFAWEIVRPLFNGKIIEMNAGAQLVHLLTKPDSTPSSATGAARTYARHWTPLHLDIVVADLDASLARAQSAGAQIERPISDHAWGRIAGLADPYGHGFCLIQLSQTGYDAVAG